MIAKKNAIFGEAMSEAPSPRYVNEQYLLNIIRKQLNITDDDMRSVSTVKSKVREANLDKILEN